MVENKVIASVTNVEILQDLQRDLAGVVILYNPLDDVWDNIQSYIDYLGVLYVVDNSEKFNETLVEKLKHHDNVCYINNHGNMGISYSLNMVLKNVQNKYRWLLTMDQDTSFLPNTFIHYASCIYELVMDLNPVYGICINMDEGDSEPINKLNMAEKCITSGSIINVSISIWCGGFDERLFIDEVDNEFCFRCNKKGYILLQYHKHILKHELGHPIFIHLLGRKIQSVNENYIRAYYITRNHLYIISKYPDIAFRYRNELIKFIVKIILFEPDKFRKLKYAIWGIVDYNKKIMGKLKR